MNKLNILIFFVAFVFSIAPLNFQQKFTQLQPIQTPQTLISDSAFEVSKTLSPVITTSISPIITTTVIATVKPISIQITPKPTQIVAFCISYAPMIESIAKQWSVRPQLLLALLKHESGCNPKAVSKSGQDHGMAQVNMPSHPNVTLEMAEDPIWSVEFAANKMSYLITKYKDEGAALIRYNCGEAYDVVKYPNCGVEYSQQILQMAK